ncbi:hypothetical protein [Oleiharenicola sp. Vm1]|uniref:hypothetical protein n=1 Tax=Oleiharenicola sp. Vm1 TaxID=3398393 RepID=UPI0039F5F5C4
MAASVPRLRPPRWLVWGWLAAMAVAHAWQAASVSDEFSTTADEIAHLTAGYSYWQDRDYRLQPENGLLPQRWAALPLLGRDLKQLDRAHKAWAEADVWTVGDRFFHQSGNDLAAMLRSGRAMIALLGGVLVFAVGLWAWQLVGAAGAFVASTLAAFSPTLLAHAGLVTSDTAAALGFVLAAAAWWRLLHRVTPGRIAGAGLALGYLLLAKFSAVLFAPMALLMLAVRLVRRTPLHGRRGAARLAPSPSPAPARSRSPRWPCGPATASATRRPGRTRRRTRASRCRGTTCSSHSRRRRRSSWPTAGPRARPSRSRRARCRRSCAGARPTACCRRRGSTASRSSTAAAATGRRSSPATGAPPAGGRSSPSPTC